MKRLVDVSNDVNGESGTNRLGNQVDGVRLGGEGSLAMVLMDKNRRLTIPYVELVTEVAMSPLKSGSMTGTLTK